MATDFDPQSEVVERTIRSGNMREHTFDVEVGNHCAVTFFEVAPANAAAANAKLAELAALCVQSGKYVWSPITAQPGCRAQFYAKGVCKDHVPVEI